MLVACSCVFVWISSRQTKNQSGCAPQIQIDSRMAVIIAFSCCKLDGKVYAVQSVKARRTVVLSLWRFSRRFMKKGRKNADAYLHVVVRGAVVLGKRSLVRVPAHGSPSANSVGWGSEAVEQLLHTPVSI